MTNSRPVGFIGFAAWWRFRHTFGRELQQATAIAMMFLLVSNGAVALQSEPRTSDGARPQASQSQRAQAQASPPTDSTFTLPAGTKLPLGLLRPLTAKAGRDVYLQITFPITLGSQMLIPPGTYVKGVVEKIIRRNRARGILEFDIGSANLIFSNGYTVAIPDASRATTTVALVPAQPGSTNGQPVAAMSAVGSSVPPTLPAPSLGNGPRNAAIVVGVLAAAGATAAILLARHRDDEVEAGTPLEIILPAPMVLDADRVMAAIQQYDRQTSSAPPQIVKPPAKAKMCYDPGTPGTPDTVIPGTPGTPPSGDFPGTPGTPDTVIPGTPGTPSSSYPCPK